jgi:NadR type nicotinamide-nucleotide adenylyltransferase
MITKAFARGLVVGKFYPPHLGHQRLIEKALAKCETVDVLVIDNPRYKIPATQRATWLRELFSGKNCVVHVMPDICVDNDSKAWARATIDFLGYAPDAVFTSEDYGKHYAKFMNCVHVPFDYARHVTPISGTKVRADFLKNWRFIVATARADLAIRVVVVGAESTGTTTLTRALATKFQAPWVPEMGRFYTDSLVPTASKSNGESVEVAWKDEDFIAIGQLQQHYENLLAARSDGLIFCDTNASATVLWQKRYQGTATPAMRELARHDRVDLYILTGDEIPFVQDGIRDGEHLRHRMHAQFAKTLRQSGTPFVIARGSLDESMRPVAPLITQLIADRSVIDVVNYNETSSSS